MIIDWYLNYSTSTWLGLQGSIVRPDGLDDGQLLQDSQQDTCKYKGKKNTTGSSPMQTDEDVLLAWLSKRLEIRFETKLMH